MKGDEYL